MNQIRMIESGNVVAGIDTHKDIHVAAVVNELNQVLATENFPTTRHGYKKMLSWMSSFGKVARVGIECSGTYGLGLLRYMQSSGVEVLEVTAPDKADRRKRVKDDTLDAENAAHAAFSLHRTVTSKARDGMVESLRVLKSCRKSAVAARTVALQMIRTSIVSAPEELRDKLRHMTRMNLVRTLASTRPDLTNYRNITATYRVTLKSLARRYIELHDEIADLDKMIATIVEILAPELLEQTAVGYESAAQLLITLGDNPERLKSESSFAALCGVSPIPASSEKTNRHRLNRGGDRAANSALHIIAIGRLRTEERSKAYIKKRTGDGLSKMEALRCLKRYIARELYYLLKNRNTSINSVQITT